MAKQAHTSAPIVIKKYANRRLYNTESSSYVTLDDLAKLVRDGREFVVRDAKSGEDITRSVLTQIIFELEGKGQQLLPIPFLRNLIGLYGDRLESMVPGYLQSSMEAFKQNEDRMRQIFENSLDPGNAMELIDEAARQNMAMFENAMRMFNPFAAQQKQSQKADSPPESSDQPDEKIDALEKQLVQMQKQLDAMRKK